MLALAAAGVAGCDDAGVDDDDMMLGEGGQGGEGGGMPPSIDCGDLPVEAGALAAIDADIFQLSGQSGATAGAVGTCGGDGNESVVAFQAPAAGWYTFTTIHPDADFDTVLYARADCTDDTEAAELGCNDDIGGIQSGLLFQLEAEQTIALFVDAYDGTGGEWILTAIRADDDAAPVLGEGAGVTNPEGGFFVDIAGSDANGDMISMRAEFTIDGVPTGEEPITFNADPTVFGQRDFVQTFSGGLPNILEVNGIRLVAIDSQGNESAPVDLSFADQPILGEGDACDPRGVLNLCGDGLFCPDVASPVCTVANAPSVMTATFTYNPENSGLGFDIAGMDPDEDVVGFRIELFDADGASVLADVLVEFDSLEQADGNFVGRGGGFVENLPPIASARIWVTDAQGLESEPVDADAQAPAARALDEACDPNGIFDTCPAEAACLVDDAGDSVCTTIAAPVLIDARAWYNPATGGVGFELTGSDADDDTDAFQFVLIDAAGEPVPVQGDPSPFQLAFDTIEPTDDGFVGRLSGLLPEGTPPFTQVRVWLLDAQDQLSESADVDLMAPVAIERDAECDLAGAFNACPAGDICFADPAGDAAPTCIEPVVACPADYATFDLNANANDGGWSVDGDTTGAPPSEGGSCGGGAGAHYYSFTAPAAGQYVFRTSGDEGTDTVLYARQFCGVGGPASELACNDDASADGTSAISLELAADESVTIVVDGFIFFEAWQGAYTLEAFLAVPPVLEDATIFLNRDTGAISAEVLGTAGSFSGVRYEILDADAAVIAEGTWFGEIEIEDGAFLGAVNGLLDVDARAAAASARLWAVDGVGIESMVVAVAMFQVPVVVEEGDACDPSGARTACNESSCVAADDGFACTVIAFACPDDWTVVDLNAGNVGENLWSVDGDLARDDLEDHGVGSCGEPTGANELFSFTAPAAGVYRFETSSAADNADTTIWARAACGVPETELQCNDDKSLDDYLSVLDLPLLADETIYLFVDSYLEDGRAAYTLDVSLAPLDP